MSRNEIETDFIPNFEIPTWVLTTLRPEALLKGCSNGKSSIARWGLIRAAEQLRDEKEKARIAGQAGQNAGSETA